MMLPSEEFATRLLQWFDRHGRHHLPWQQDITAYRVWVSEVMLQQTQVATVVPYYARFMARFPDVEALAHAGLDEVLHLWTGLGYYARGRNLHACAKVVVLEHGGYFPTSLEGMMALPGIGRSTAGAILAIACGARHPILDGNVKRVLSRVFGIGGDPARTEVQALFWQRAEACTPAARIGAYTQAIMDLGATLCTRARPACTVCPMNDACIAALEGRQRDFPGRTPKRARPVREAILLIAQRQTAGGPAVFVERRPAEGLWGGLWSPPQFGSAEEALAWASQGLAAHAGAEALPVITHGFTHFDLVLQPVRVHCGPAGAVRDGEQLWFALLDPPRVGLPQPIRRLFQELRAAADAGA